MMNPISFLIHSLLSFQILVSLVMFPLPHIQASDTIWIVTLLEDGTDGSCTDGNCSLRDAIDLAAPGDTIRFSVGGTLNLLGGELLIQKSLKIVGPGPGQLIINARHKSRAINIYAGAQTEVFLSGMTIKNGLATLTFGGGISNSALPGGSKLIISNCVFQENTAEGDGGAIYSTGPLTVSGSSFNHNQAYTGGAISGSFAPLTIANSLFTENTATSGNGGAVYSYRSAVEINFSRFYHNSGENGGGIWFASTVSSLRGTRFSENTARLNGGGIAVDRLSALTLENSTLDANQAEIANGSGGGIYNQGTLTIVNGSFFKNSAGAGGGLLNERGGSASVTNSSFLENSASRTAGGIFSWTAAVTAQNSILSSSMRGGNCGGSLFAANSKANFSTDSSCTPGFQQAAPEELALKFQGAVLVLQPDSIAIDNGNPAACPAVDQSLSPRSVDGNGDGITGCDAGAYEYLPQEQRLYMPLVANQAGFSTP